MRFMLLIYGDETQWDYSPKAMAPWAKFNEEVAERNQFSAALQETAKAATVRIREGKVVATDGPFAETKEQLGGFYLVECDNIDEAMEIAAKIPAAPYGSVEVRPVMEFQQ